MVANRQWIPVASDRRFDCPLHGEWLDASSMATTIGLLSLPTYQSHFLAQGARYPRLHQVWQ
jgi:hypothetical protein